MRTILSLAFPLALAVLGCGPKTVYTDLDVPRLGKLDDLMWAQAQSTDPQFKKIGAASYTDGDYEAFVAVAGRLKLTSERLKEPAYSKGDGWNRLADQLAQQGADLGAAGSAKDAAKSSQALADIKATCKGCHKQFR